MIRGTMMLALAVALAGLGELQDTPQEPCVPEVRETPELWTGDRYRVSVQGVGVEYTDDYSYALEIAFREKREAPQAEVLVHDEKPVEIICRAPDGAGE